MHVERGIYALLASSTVPCGSGKSPDSQNVLFVKRKNCTTPFHYCTELYKSLNFYNAIVYINFIVCSCSVAALFLVM
jgi:hypothetical protein